MLKSDLDSGEERQFLFRQGYTNEDVEEILDRAARLQAHAADRTDPETLLQSAEEAGIRREFMEEAMRELAIQRQGQENPPGHQAIHAQQGLARVLALIGGVLFGLFFFRFLGMGFRGVPVIFALVALINLGIVGLIFKRFLASPHRRGRGPRGRYGPGPHRGWQAPGNPRRNERVCFHCGRVNSADARFCNDCGEEMERV